MRRINSGSRRRPQGMIALRARIGRSLKSQAALFQHRVAKVTTVFPVGVEDAHADAECAGGERDGFIQAHDFPRVNGLERFALKLFAQAAVEDSFERAGDKCPEDAGQANLAALDYRPEWNAHR